MRLKLLLVFILTGSLNAQITLQECYKKTISAYPLKKQIGLNESSAKRTIANLDAKYLPDLSLQAQAKYQSDVSKVNINIPPTLPFKIDFPSLAKDQYTIYLGVNQLIWDGGLISGQKEVEEMKTKADNSSVNADLYSLYDRVNQIYFRILTGREHIKSLENMKSDLLAKLTQINSAVENGVMLAGSSYQLRAEILKLDQSINEISSMDQASFDMLSELTGEKIDSKLGISSPADLPIEQILNGNFGERPEYRQFESQKDYISSLKSLTSKKDLPKFFAFAQAGYGKPGLNMFDPDFATFYFVGVRASWNFWTWNTKENDIASLEIKNQVIETGRETLEKNLKVQSNLVRRQIESISSRIATDDQIIELRGKVISESESRLTNGAITISDYLTDFNAEARARLDKSLHNLELIQAKYSALNLYGKIR